MLLSIQHVVIPGRNHGSPGPIPTGWKAWATTKPCASAPSAVKSSNDVIHIPDGLPEGQDPITDELHRPDQLPAGSTRHSTELPGPTLEQVSVLQ